jgi:DNA-binding NtrC family response regulator
VREYAVHTQPKVLLIRSAETESKVLEGVLREHVRLDTIASPQELEVALANGRYDAVFCGWSFHRGVRNAALKTMLQSSPDLPVVVFCGTGGEQEWIEVLDAGGFDLLVPPYQTSTVLPVLEHAVVSNKARRFHRDMSHSVARAAEK